MDLETVQAALAELERKQKSLINKIKYANQVADDHRARAERFRADVAEVQDQILALVVQERELKEAKG
jgi:hypothetical protein